MIEKTMWLEDIYLSPLKGFARIIIYEQKRILHYHLFNHLYRGDVPLPANGGSRSVTPQKENPAYRGTLKNRSKIFRTFTTQGCSALIPISLSLDKTGSLAESMAASIGV